MRTGISNDLDVANAKITVFAPDNTALAAAGITSTTVSAIPLTTLTAVINYHVIPAENIAAAQIAVRPAAGPLTESEERLIRETNIPPITPANNPE